ncbi:sugar transferase [Devosia nitrariae]|uniref:Bacterial sugar transferase domain-containing protein n=1 Tax=Devosia nitrariae TaxID=2071872 RepID=A0ABQ5W463_9HYPH|nr:sugar transferase [Devosia nitrariae]GLQ54696.1 hypothetical protein GCM10010862_19550 [Devosia nitrariae]
MSNAQPTPEELPSQPRPRRRAPKAAESSVPLRAPDLLGIVERGANVRRHRWLRDLAIILPSVAVSALLQCAIYASFILRATRSDWNNLAIVCFALCLVPLVAGALLPALRRHEFPITVAVVVTAVVFNFAVAVLSALRIPVSYWGLLSAAPVAILGMVYTNLSFRRAVRDRVAILDFPGARKVLELLGDDVVVITNRSENVAGFDRILIDSEAHHSALWSKLLTRIYMLGIDVTPWISFVETRLGRVDVESFDIAHLVFSPSQIYYSKVKRLVDVTAVLIALPLAVPLGALVWLYIRALDGGPALFRQERRGHGGSTFTMLKFRTMYRGTNGGATQPNDNRVMPGCRFLRALRLDELPQLVNILRGEMSWIGPRPVAVPIAEALEATIPQYVHRQLVLPGLSGWAQVSHGYASNHREEIEKLAYDLYYIKEMSFDLDLLILAKTLRTLLFRSKVH